MGLSRRGLSIGKDGAVVTSQYIYTQTNTQLNIREFDSSEEDLTNIILTIQTIINAAIVQNMKYDTLLNVESCMRIQGFTH